MYFRFVFTIIKMKIQRELSHTLQVSKKTKKSRKLKKKYMKKPKLKKN